MSPLKIPALRPLPPPLHDVRASSNLRYGRMPACRVAHAILLTLLARGASYSATVRSNPIVIRGKRLDGNGVNDTDSH